MAPGRGHNDGPVAAYDPWSSLTQTPPNWTKSRTFTLRFVLDLQPDLAPHPVGRWRTVSCGTGVDVGLFLLNYDIVV